MRHFFTSSLWTIDLEAASVGQRLLIQSLRLAIAVGIEFRQRLLDARAASLVYTTLLSFVPVLAVMFSVLKAFGIHYQIEPFLTRALAPLGPQGAELTLQMLSFVDNLKLGVLGIAAIAGLFYTTYSLIGKIEETLNAIWRVRQGRSWTRKFTDYLSVLLVGPLLIVTALGLIASVQSHALVQEVLSIQPFGLLVVSAAKLVPFVLLGGVFTFVYKFLPYTQVRFFSALLGGAAGAVLWGLAGAVFTQFVAGSANYNAIYSSFAILVLFLLWLYISWLIVLLGAQLSFFHQYPSAFQADLLWYHGTHAFREHLTLRLLGIITRRYLQGALPESERTLATATALPLPIVQEQITHLVELGIVCRMLEPEGIGLLKPPELVSVSELLQAIRVAGVPNPQVLPTPGDGVAAVLQRRDEAVERALSGLTLRSFVAQEGG